MNRKMIDKNSSIPMYRQIANTLKSEILQGKYDSTKTLGTHMDLAERFSVSMITIRKAMRILDEEKLVEIRQGKGTFVKNQLPHDSLQSLTGISNVLSSQNILSSQEIKTFELIDVPDHFPEAVQQQLGEQCLHIERIHKVEQITVAYADLYLPVNYGKKISRSDVEKNTIYQIYQNKLGIKLGKGWQRIAAAPADTRVSKLLEVKENSPVLWAERKAYSAEGCLIEYMQMFYEYRHYSFEVELMLSAE